MEFNPQPPAPAPYALAALAVLTPLLLVGVILLVVWVMNTTESPFLMALAGVFGLSFIFWLGHHSKLAKMAIPQASRDIPRCALMASESDSKGRLDHAEFPDHLVTQNLYSTLEATAFALYANLATRRYREELRSIGRGFHRLIHGNPLDEEILEAINTLHVAHPDKAIALCRAFTRIVNFNYDPDWSDDSKFDAAGLHIWPDDGSEWRS